MLAMLAIKIGMLGAGRMATALARGVVEAGVVPPESIYASDPSSTARDEFARVVPGARLVNDNSEVARQCELLLLAVKPQQMDEVLSEIRGAIRGDSLVVSIAAGIPLARLAKGLPPGQRIVRVMPNTPCLIGQGVSCFALDHNATEGDADMVSALLSAVGVAFQVPESQLDAVTGLSGSGPAFVYTMIEALTAGGVEVGLPPKLAADLAGRTVAGAAQMVLQTAESPAVLRDRVTSPGGTTQAGLAVLEQSQFDKAVVGAVSAAARRSAELGRSAK